MEVIDIKVFTHLLSTYIQICEIALIFLRFYRHICIVLKNSGDIKCSVDNNGDDSSNNDNCSMMLLKSIPKILTHYIYTYIYIYIYIINGK